jgi:hypothetical protein
MSPKTQALGLSAQVSGGLAEAGGRGDARAVRLDLHAAPLVAERAARHRDAGLDRAVR